VAGTYATYQEGEEKKRKENVRRDKDIEVDIEVRICSEAG
jgi:hypothetical protein